MSSPNAQPEPTMEEILASIRKIISEDASEPSESAAPEGDPEVLELTQEVQDDGPIPVAPATSHPQSAAPADDVVFETIEEKAMPESVSTESAPAAGGIFSDKTRAALDDAFNKLETEDKAAAPAAAASSGAPLPAVGGNIESVFDRAIRESFDPVLRDHLKANADVIIERMKPIIREWMDEHFPALLDGAVRAEVERVVKARGHR